jgi:hypothetical protein
LFTSTGASSSTAHDSTSYAPGKLESNSSAEDAMEVEQSDDGFLLVGSSRTNTSSSAGFSTPSAGTTMGVDQVVDAADASPIASTLPIAPGTRWSTPCAMDALSTVAASDADEPAVNDDGVRLSVAKLIFAQIKSRPRDRSPKYWTRRRTLRTTLKFSYNDY